jgi:hypothetical protein
MQYKVVKGVRLVRLTAFGFRLADHGFKSCPIQHTLNPVYNVHSWYPIIVAVVQSGVVVSSGLTALLLKSCQIYARWIEFTLLDRLLNSIYM